MAYVYMKAQQQAIKYGKKTASTAVEAWKQARGNHAIPTSYKPKILFVCLFVCLYFCLLGKALVLL